MNKIILNEKSRIYILCPAYIKTGGPELLHQLCWKLNERKIDATMAYYNISDDKNYRNKEFDIYTDKFVQYNEIDDDTNNFLIIPEDVVAINLSKRFKNIKKIIWWLSVDNFTKGYGVLTPLKVYGLKYLKMIKNKAIIFNLKYVKSMYLHLCQSYYAIDYLKKIGINNSIYLSDYINHIYLSNHKAVKKENIVLFNPKKGYNFTQKIIKASPNMKWIAIQNLTSEGVLNLLLKSKVYVDFGHHPGKDRFPREAASCGCCIITGMKGAAKYYEDVSIPAEFKFESNKKEIANIISKIEECFNNFDSESLKFDDYRKKIKLEEQKFERDIEEIFIVK